MDILLYAAQLIAGFLLLTHGANWLITGGSTLALRIGISTTVVGLTVMAFGTSMPELTVNVSSALSGNTGIALGNILGSNIANIALILGITAMISPMAVAEDFLGRDFLWMTGAAVLLFVAMLDGTLSFPEGAVFLALGIGYTWHLIAGSRKEERQDPGEAHGKGRGLLINGGLVVLGLVALVAGGKLCVDSAVSFARFFGMSERVIGLTVVAVGTSMPEFAASLAAALKGRAEMAIGNIIGSNIFNILIILGITAMVHPIHVAVDARYFVDMSVMLGVTLLLWPLMRTGMTLVRLEGALLFSIYSGYIAYLLLLAD
ncbi:calcium/sodium antiporter [Myxococcota bacterium]|nr:calcium/sodium antiporter [Myxococcota bacterium]MBU1411118.1 calcium/sodium antiporter [Myxococcota bacterium]MBU1512228.1 calcium/sodium antiporter [Myxococcota bacterium]